jgi:hypothetical protein
LLRSESPDCLMEAITIPYWLMHEGEMVVLQ